MVSKPRTVNELKNEKKVSGQDDRMPTRFSFSPSKNKASTDWSSPQKSDCFNQESLSHLLKNIMFSSSMIQIIDTIVDSKVERKMQKVISNFKNSIIESCLQKL